MSGDKKAYEIIISFFFYFKCILNLFRDPNLWMVKCRIGEEKATALLLMRKYIAYQFSNEPLQIKSVVAPEGVKGYIYIEAFKQPHVKAAITNVGNLRMGIWQQQVTNRREWQIQEL